MMVSAIRRHPRRRHVPVPGGDLLDLRHLPRAVFGGVVAGAGARLGWAGMAEAALPQRPAVRRGVRGVSRGPVPAGLPGPVGWGWVGAVRAGSCSHAVRWLALPEPPGPVAASPTRPYGPALPRSRLRILFGSGAPRL